MARYAEHKIPGCFVVALFVPLLLTGCFKGLLSGEKPVLGPEVTRPQGTTAERQPPVAALPPEQQASGHPPNERQPVEVVGVPARPGAALLPPVLPGQTGLAAESPHGTTTGATRQFAAGPPPDFAYGDAVLTEDCAWHGEVHIEGMVTVAPQATLTIEPGSVVRFGAEGKGADRHSLLLVYGRLDARGTREKPVLFTSRFAQPMAGDWRGIVLLGSEKKNHLEACRVEGAETGLDATYAAVTLKNVQFSRCTTGARYRDSIVLASGGGASGCAIGVHMTDSEADLRGAALAGNRQGGVAERSSLYLSGGSFIHNDLESLKAVDCRVKITGGEFIANGAGIDLESSQGLVSGAKIAENADYGIRLAGSRVKVYGNEIVRNSGSGLKVADGRGAAWGNAIFANGTYDLVNGGSEDFVALGNWWGAADPASVGKRVSPAPTGNGSGRVLLLPLLTANPLAIP